MPKTPLFVPVEFETRDLQSPSEAAPAEVFPDREKFEELAKEIRGDLVDIQNGVSDLTPYPITFPKDNCLPLVLLDRFLQRPSRKALKMFNQISLQDLCFKCSETWKAKFNTILTEEGVENV